MFLAVIDGAVIGSVIATWDGWRGGIFRLVVDPSPGWGAPPSPARVDVDFLGIDIDDVYLREAARRTAALDEALVD